jgi:hypothetical protein
VAPEFYTLAWGWAGIGFQQRAYRARVYWGQHQLTGFGASERGVEWQFVAELSKAAAAATVGARCQQQPNGIKANFKSSGGAS